MSSTPTITHLSVGMHIPGEIQRKTYAEKQPDFVRKADECVKVFEGISTFGLIKRLLVHKFMTRDIFIDNAIPAMFLSYKLIGVTATNFIINSTVGEIFTAGETIQSYLEDRERFSQKNITAVGHFTAESMKHMDRDLANRFYQHWLQYITDTTQGYDEGSLAVKLTCIFPVDIMRKLNNAQN